jgi:hypothetical protein
MGDREIAVKVERRGATGRRGLLEGSREIEGERRERRATAAAALSPCISAGSEPPPMQLTGGEIRDRESPRDRHSTRRRALELPVLFVLLGVLLVAPRRIDGQAMREQR